MGAKAPIAHASCSTATDRNDDFEVVTVSQYLLGKLATRYNFTVTLQRDPLANQSHTLNKLGNADSWLNIAGYAIYEN